MVRNSQVHRVAQLEATRSGRSLIEETDYRWNADDEEFFAIMFERALAGDRNWSQQQEARYHALILNEPWKPKA